MRRLLTPCLALFALAVLAAPADAEVRVGPAGAAFHKPPAKLPGKRHGDAIWQRGATPGIRLAGAARNTLVLYRGLGDDGRTIAVSGAMAVPRGSAPRGGWPVVTYAHGTTGIADQCAPSAFAGESAVSPNTYTAALLNRWVKAGWAVVRTDYEGLGTPGVHPYLNGRSEGRSVLDMVLAAKQVDPRISTRRVVIAGHSQGGHAALFAAAVARTYTRRLGIRGTVALAPASNLDEQARFIPLLSSRGGGLSGLIALILRGIDTSRDDLDVSSVLSDRARALYPQTLDSCLGALGGYGSFGDLAPKEILREGANLDALATALDANDPENLRIPTRVRIDQGTADTTVLPTFTDDLVEALRDRGVQVDYSRYEGVGHSPVIDAAAVAATRWIRRRLAR